MLKDLIQKFNEDYEMNIPLHNDSRYTLYLHENLQVQIVETPDGLSLYTKLAPIPKMKEDSFLGKLMYANLFGQATNGAVIGLSENGNYLTLTKLIDYNVDYQEFKEILEDFLNAAFFWREETLNLK